MKLETWKTIILMFLIGLSLLLTLAIWNYQPTFDPITDEDDAIDAQLDGNVQSKKQTIQANQIIYHVEGQPLGLEDKTAEQDLYKQIQEWSVFDFSSTSVNYEEINYATDQIEVIFPAELPSETIKDLFSVDEEVVPSGSFDRMFIQLSGEAEDAQLLFVASQTGAAIQANVQNYSQIVTYLDEYREQHKTINYEIFESTEQTRIYLPSEIELSSYIYSYQELEVDPFINLLFYNNPSAVKSSFLSGGSMVYTDGTRELIRDSYQISFTDPTKEAKNTDDPISDYQLLDQVHNDFMNPHLGFTTTDPFRFVLSEIATTTTTNRVNYHLTYQGYPVFATEALATISVQWNDQSIHKYTHPLIQLADMRGNGQATNLPDATTVISILQTGSYQNSSIYDVAVGYKVEEQSGEQVYRLTPTWYVEGVNGWETLQIPEEMVGGDHRAMGTN